MKKSKRVGRAGIKSLFLLNGVDFPWTHSIVDLLDELKGILSIENEENSRRLLEWVEKQTQ